MAALRERENAVLQGQVWATGSHNLGGAGVKLKEVRINCPRLQGGAKATLPSRDATRGIDPIFSDDLRLEYRPSREAILLSIINNSLQPINIMKPSTAFAERRTDKGEDKYLDRPNYRGVNHLLQCCRRLNESTRM